MKKNLWLLALVLMAGLLLVLLIIKPETQGIQQLRFQNDSTIAITEVCAKNESVIADNDGKYRDYIELYNSGAPISLKGFTFYNGKVKSAPLDDIVLETGEYRVFFISRSNSGFALSASGGETVQLLNAAGNIVAQTNIALLNTDEVMLYVNGSFRNSYDASPGFSNDATGRTLFLEGEQVAQLPLVISEVLVRNVSSLPDERGMYSDMVELCNLSDQPINLERYFLSDDLQARFAFRLPGLVLAPGEFIVLCCDGENYISENGLIHTNFGLSHGETLVLSECTGAYVALTVEAYGEDISTLLNADGTYGAGYPSLGYENTEDGTIAMERSGTNPKSPLYISEVLLSSAGVPYAGAFCDVIEIANVSIDTVSTAGWYLSDGGDPYEYLLPETLLLPGESIVIRCGTQYTGFSLSEGEVLRLTGPDYKHAPLLLCVEPEYGKSISLLEAGEEPVYAYMDVTLGYPNEEVCHGDYLEGQLLPELQISEVMSSNGSYLKGPYGNTCDWLELYNASSVSIQLSDYCITDNKGNLHKYVLPDRILEPGQYLVILLSDVSVNLLRGYDVLPLTLAVDGEHIYLTKGDQIVDYMLIPSIPHDMSYGRQPGSSVHTLLQKATPGTENSVRVEMTAAPVAETKQGCYDGVDYVDVILSGEGEIYYTTNCYAPTVNSSRYTGPIRLTKTTVLRVMCRAEGKMQSEIIDLTYLINENDNLPVVSIVANPADLFSEWTGIYTTGSSASEEVPYYGANYWMGWEKAACISLFETDGSGFSAKCGIKVFGNYSRIYEKKSLSCMFRSQYGVPELEYPLFGEAGLDTYESFILRSGGQDFADARIRDELVTSLVGDYTDVPVQAYRPVILYLNGQYWGIHYIREKLTEHYLGGHYNTEPENMEVVYPSDGRNEDYWELINFVRTHDMSVPENYAYVCTKMDVDNYIDFLIAQMWIANTDLPGNIKFFQNPEGKWTWILFDADISVIDASADRVTFVFEGPQDDEGDIIERIFAVELIKNPEFREKFFTRMAWQMNTIWTEENVLGRINEIAGMIAPDMEKECDRWSDSYASWEHQLDVLRQFAKERNGYILQHIQSYFRLTDAQMRDYGFCM